MLFVLHLSPSVNIAKSVIVMRVIPQELNDAEYDRFFFLMFFILTWFILLGICTEKSMECSSWMSQIISMFHHEAKYLLS